jgi:hypothetical protein
MKLPSLQRLTTEAARVWRRFPLTLLCGFVLGFVGVYYIHLDFQEGIKLDWLFPALSTAGLGLTLTLAAALVAERRGWSTAGRWAMQAGAGVLLAIWYDLVPAQPDLVWGLRLALVGLGLHLAVAAGPYLSELRRGADTPGFWHYNETLFLRILTAALYSGVLFAGCALALVAIEHLFDVDLNRHVYPDLFVLLATVFNTWFFLAGVPEDFAALEAEGTYPKGLKLFTQFVLLPLVVLYMGILYAYLGRITLAWTLPKGWVSTLVLALAVAGIFALLLIHPIRNSAENTWIRTFARWFYRALFPLLALLVVAISTRIRAYGITEERYFVLVLAAWLFCMAVYFLVRRGQGIVWIPASLAVVAFLSAAGPWSAFAVAQRSQLAQLHELAGRYHLFKDGRLDGAGKRVPKLPLAARKRLTSIVEFFTERDAVSQLQPLFATSLTLPDSLRNSSGRMARYQQTDKIFAASGIAQANRYQSEEETELSASFYTQDRTSYALGEGRYWLSDVSVHQYSKPQPDSTITEIAALTGSFRLRTQHRGRNLVLEQRANGGWLPRLTLHPGALADSLAREYGRNPERRVELPAKSFVLQASDKGITLKLFLKGLSREERQQRTYYYFSGDALFELN